MLLYHDVLRFCYVLTFKTATFILTVSFKLSIKRHHINFAQKH